MTAMQTRITKGSLISVGLLIPIIGIVWAASAINSKVEASATEIQRHESDNSRVFEKHDQLLIEIKDQLHRVQTDIAIIKEQTK